VSSFGFGRAWKSCPTFEPGRRNREPSSAIVCRARVEILAKWLPRWAKPTTISAPPFSPSNPDSTSGPGKGLRLSFRLSICLSVCLPARPVPRAPAGKALAHAARITCSPKSVCLSVRHNPQFRVVRARKRYSASLMRRIGFVLFGMQNTTFGPYLATMLRIRRPA
jgi:hypothetical protein